MSIECPSNSSNYKFNENLGQEWNIKEQMNGMEWKAIATRKQNKKHYDNR